MLLLPFGAIVVQFGMKIIETAILKSYSISSPGVTSKESERNSYLYVQNCEKENCRKITTHSSVHFTTIMFHINRSKSVKLLRFHETLKCLFSVSALLQTKVKIELGLSTGQWTLTFYYHETSFFYGYNM